MTILPAHAAWLQACEATASPERVPQASITRPDGSVVRLSVTSEAVRAGCRGTPLAVPAGQVAGLHPLPPGARPANTILLEGSEQDGRFLVNSHTLPPATPAPEAPAPMPLGSNLLAAMQLRSFGVEERVRARLHAGRLEIECAAGNRPAGVLLSGPWYLPRADVAMHVRFSGAGRFTWQVADAGLALRERALDAGLLRAGARAADARLPLPQGLDRQAWRQFALVCPAGPARLVIDSLSLETAPPGPAPARASWVWDSERWRDHGEALLEWAAREGLGELFIVVPLDGSRVREPGALARFVRQARTRGIAVSTVDGDPRMVLPSEHAKVVQRVRAYAAYNAQVDPGARLSTLQFDIEPYLLPGYASAAPDWERRYIELLRKLRRAAGGMRLEFVVPFWWAHNDALMRALARNSDALTVMDYRTDPEQIYRFAVPFLDWGQQHGKQVRIALEAGPVAPETQRRYQRTVPGEAADLLFAEAAGVPVLVLLRQPASQVEGPGFRLAGSRHLDGSATSFHGKPDTLRKLLPGLERQFGAWSGFAGLALHEWR